LIYTNHTFFQPSVLRNEFITHHLSLLKVSSMKSEILAYCLMMYPDQQGKDLPQYMCLKIYTGINECMHWWMTLLAFKNEPWHLSYTFRHSTSYFSHVPKENKSIWCLKLIGLASGNNFSSWISLHASQTIVHILHSVKLLVPLQASDT
jgi:hypothetical protein